MVDLRTQDDPKDLETNTTLAKLMASFLALLFFFFFYINLLDLQLVGRVFVSVLP